MRVLELAVMLVVSGGAVAQAEEAQPSPSTDEARALATRYLEAVKAKRWPDVRKLTHPQTLKAIAERKQRLGKEDHPMAPWFHASTTAILRSYRITAVKPASAGTVVVETSEDNFQLEEKGLAENEPAAYLLGKKAGRWYLVDKKRGDTFSDQSIRLGYRGYFDPLE
jgi:hypothetical protein